MNLDDYWAARRAADRRLDDRLATLGFKVGARHVDGCPVGVVRGSPCMCREVVARREDRRRAQADRTR